MEKHELVVLKVDTNIVKGVFDFRVNHFYRCMEVSDGYLVYGQFVTKKEFDLLFETVYDRVIRDFKEIGILGEDNKPISRSLFAKLADVHEYGRGRNHLRIYYFRNTKEKIYGFYPTRGTKADNLAACYEWYLKIISGDVEPLDGRELYSDGVKFGNSGISLTYGTLRIT